MHEYRLRWREMLPIVARELRMASKRRVTYRLRWVAALFGGVEIFLAAAMAGASVEVGKFVFWCTSGIMLLICGLSGLLLTVDSISREKREGTLGLLFLTRLVGTDVVLGKLAVGALSGAAVAFATLPFLAFSLCLGGVTAREFWVMSALLLFLLAYSLTLGIFLSTLFRREAAVSLAFLFLMIGPVASVPLALLKWKTIPTLWAYLNPVYPALALIDSGEIFFPHELARPALAFQAAAIFLMLAFCCVYLPWTVKSHPFRPKRPDAEVLGKLRRASRRGILETNPVLWLSQRQNHPLMLLTLCVGLYVVIGFATTTPMEGEITYVILLAILPKLFVLWQSSGLMAAERQSGFLESLLTTPISGGEVLRGKMSAIKRQIAPALLFALLIQWATSSKWWAADGEINIGATLIFASMMTLLIDVHTIGWVGLWQGLAARDRRRALIRAALWGLVAPWIPGFIALGLLGFLFDPRWMNDPVNLAAPALISANVVSFGIACLAMARLHEKFRSTATQTWSVKAPHEANI